MDDKNIFKEIILKIQDYNINILLNDSKTSLTIFNSLPFKSELSKWGNEIYFTIPVDMKLEKGIEILDIGDVAYWPPGKAMCIFFGKTPASTTEKPQAVSPVTKVGSLKAKEDIKFLKTLRGGEKVEVLKFNLQ